MSQIILQIPDPVLRGARKLAERQQMTVEEFVARMVVETVELDDAWEQRAQQGRQVTRERFLEILRNAPDVPPMPGDEIEP